MATINLGLMKINTDDGLAFSFGNGGVHRIPLGGRKQPDPAPQGAYDGDYDGYDGAGAYDDDGYGRPPYDSYDGDSYAGYADDGYAGGDYGDDGYSDDGYTDAGYDDGGYGDDGYTDEDDYGAPYGDRYGEEDAGGYSDEGAAGGNPVLNYIDDNDWVTYALLVLLPPLGIYLLWRRQMFDYTTRWAVSAISGVWCVVVLILMFSAVLSGVGDATSTPLNMGTVRPTSELTSPEATNSLLEDMTGSGTSLGLGTGSDGAANALNGGDGISPAQTMDLLAPDASPSATPLPGYNGSTNTLLTAGTVLVTATGPYYHNNPNCSYLQTGDPTSKLTEDVALQRSKTPCPVCYPGQTIYYHTANGQYYHLDKNCSDMTNPLPVTEEQAKTIGQPACPVCITHELKSLDAAKGLIYCDENTTDRSGINVYCTQNGDNFHVRSDCRGMTGAKSVGLLKAMLAGKTACETCCPTAGRLVWFRADSTYFHSERNCSKMTGAHQATVAEALVMGKAQCKTCMGNVQLNFDGNGVKTTTTDNKKNNNNGGNNAATTTGGVYVFATEGGQYYHTNATCTGMTGAKRVLLSTMLKQNRPACPTCAKGADTVVYATQYGTYYHSYATCSGMTGAVQGTMAQAMAAGKKRCPDCWKATGGTTTNTTTNQTAARTTNTGTTKTNTTTTQKTNNTNNRANTTTQTRTNTPNIKASGTFVYATKTSQHYHTNANCSGMTNALRVDLAVAVYYGKTACATCASAAGKYVYSTDNGNYYHAKSSCGTMTNGKRRTLQSALLLGQKMCPTCKAEAEKKASANNNKTNNNKTNNNKTNNNKTNNNANNNTTTQPVTNVQAHTLPATTTQNIVSSGKFSAGQSGMKVYASANDKYFHGYRQHAGNGAVQVTLETAMNYGKTACPTCLKAARTTVYAVRGGRYYHSSKKCAGTGAVSGKLASALGYGLDACPVCVTRTKIVTNSNTFKSGASGIKVWATLSGSYFHGDRSCAGAGASQVTLETAINYGKTPCPNCASSAKYTVYSSESDKYYHSSREHAGNGATSGYWAIALAMGKKACPVCIGGSEAYEDSDIHYSAPGDTRVYVNINSYMFYYHKSANCGDGGMSNGTGVALEFAVNWGYHACPYCNPPTSVS